MELSKVFFAALACCALFINVIYLFQSDNREREYVGYSIMNEQYNESRILFSLLRPNSSKHFKNKTYHFLNKDEMSKNCTNPHPYVYLTNPGHAVCSKVQEVLLLAFVTIAVDNFEQRDIIRTTWSNKKLFPKLKTVFMVGLSKSDEINRKVYLENQYHGDIVQESFMDTYFNLTLKTIQGFKWAAKYCKNARFVMKIDDDVVVNSFYLISYLEKLKYDEPNLNNTIMGRYFPNAPVNRKQSSKFYTSREEHPADSYNPYCDGPVYITSQDMPEKLYEISLNTKLFRLEDVYMGSLAIQLKTRFVDLTKKYQIMKRKFKLKHLTKTDEILFYYTSNPFYFASLWYFLHTLVTRPDPNFYFSVNPIDYDDILKH